METTMYNIQGKEAGKIDLPEVFNVKVSPVLLQEVVVAYLANQREGSHSTKTRAEVRGGGAKPVRQKGTGRARAGTIRSPLWRTGGIVFGPKPRSYYVNMPKKKRQSALKMALTEKARQNSIVVVESISIEEPKTKNVAAILKNLNITNEKILMVIDKTDDKLKTASKNIKNLCLTDSGNVNTYQILWAKKIVMTPEAVKVLGDRG